MTSTAITDSKAPASRGPARAGRARRGRSRTGKLILTHAAALFVTAICAGPIILIVIGSFRPVPFSHFTLGLKSWTLQNYRNLFHESVVIRWIVNSLIVATATSAITVVVDVLAAYAFAKLRFPGRNAAFLVLLGTMMLPFSVTLVPTYLIASKLNLLDSYVGLIIPTTAGAFGVFMMRQFVNNIPDSIIESARVDGASQGRTFLTIIVPLCAQPMAVLSIFTFVISWNSFLWPLLVAESNNMRTITVGIATTDTQFSQNLNGLTAVTVISLIPTALLFVLFQRHFIRGVLAGAVKG